MGNSNLVWRTKENYKTEANFIRVHVNHWSFVTALLGKLEGKSGGPEDSSVGVNIILNADIFEECKVIKPDMFHPLEKSPDHNVLEGALFECCDLLTWIAGTYDSKSLKEHNHENQPTEFTVETWKAKDDINTWQLVKKTYWSGVKWLDMAHTGDGGDRACAGIATFTCENKTVEEVDGEIVKLPNNTRYHKSDLRRILQQKLTDPKHPASYMG